MRIVSDKFNKHQERMQTESSMEYESFPVDLYGKRVFPKKSDSQNLANAAKDIKEYYGLNGDDGLS